jgi:hypothetical protein
MCYRGRVTNGVIVLESATLPEGMEVNITLMNDRQPGDNTGSLDQLVAELAGTVNDLPKDMAQNHDHYLHGASKR